MAALSLFALLLCAWALGCCLVYAGLRWAIFEIPGAVTSAGSMALLGWLIMYTNAFSVSYWEEEHVIPWTVSLSIHTLFYVAFGLGVLLMETNTRHRLFWWHEVLFCALYFGCAQMLLGALIVVSFPLSQPLHPFIKWQGLAINPPLSMIFVWLFPLGAPLAELLLRQMRRLHREVSV